MATKLTNIAIKTRKSIRYGIYFMIFIFIARFAINTANQLRLKFFPPAPPPPTVGFSRLPQIPFPEQDASIPSLTFTVETSTGTLPDFPISMPVYYMPKSSANLNSVDIAKEKAKALGFSPNPTEISSTLYRFRHPQVPASMEMNIITGTFSTSYNLAADPSPLNSKPPFPETAQDIAKSTLSRINSLPKDLTVFGNAQFLKLENQKLVSALSLSEANFVKVNLFRKSFGEEGQYKSLTKNPLEANVWFIISGARETEKRIIASEFHYYPIDEEQKETYPIKTSQEALDDLKKGKGYIANLGLNKEGVITIRNIYLAYYDPNVPSQFFQPIVVFEGDKGFVGYVPAVSSDYYGETETGADG